MPWRSRFSFVGVLLAVGLGGWWLLTDSVPTATQVRATETTPTKVAEVDRSPVDLMLTPDEKYLLVVNQTSHSLALVRLADGTICDEVACGERPSALALSKDGQTVYVSATFSGELRRFRLDQERLRPDGVVRLSFEPRGVVLSPDEKWAYVALTTAHALAVIDLNQWKEVQRIPTGHWPRYLDITPDGKRLAVGVSGDGGISIIDTEKRKQLFIEDFAGLNIGQIQIDKGGKYAYFPWMVYRHNPITPTNIQIGWVLASRIARVKVQEKARREAISLDPRGQAVSDPFGLALSPDEKWLACAASGTHELLMYATEDLPYSDYGGPGDHIDSALLADKDRFFRIPLGGRPMFVRFSKDGKLIYVANYLLNAVQVVSPQERKVVRTIALGGPSHPSLARKGEAIFYDGQRSLDQWYSCASCHYEGHTNAIGIDTRNDGRFGNFKMVLSLRNTPQTGPYFWHGWEKSLAEATRKSLNDSMLGPTPKDEDVQALLAYFATLKYPPNPYRNPDGSLTKAAQRGKQVFEGDKAACTRCHNGPLYTDGKNHRVGTQERGDVYPSYNTPSLIGVYSKIRWLHDGRARSLEALLTGPHDPDKVSGNGSLPPQELHDLIEFLKSL